MSNINIEELKQELQKRLDSIQIEEVQITDTSYMNDIQVGIIDTRNPMPKRETYSNDLEGELVQEFDETKDYETRLELAEKIRQERERKLIEKAKKEQKDQKEQSVKTEFVVELKAKQDELNKQIENLTQKISKAEIAKLEIEGQIKEQEGIVIKGVKAVGEKVYKVAEDEINKNRKGVSTRINTIRKLEKQRAEAQTDFNSLDAYIKEIFPEETEVEQQKTEVKQQETEMAQKDEQEIKPVEENPEKEEHSSGDSHNVEEQAREETAKQPKDEEQAEKPRSKPGETMTKKDFEKIQKIFSKESMQEFDKKYNVSQVKFYLKDEKPVYEVVLNGSDENKRILWPVDWNNVEKLPKNQLNRLPRTIEDAERFYDPNIEKILRSVDIRYGTDSLDKYMQLMQAFKMQEIESIDLKIDYDFSNLNRLPKGMQNKSKFAYIKKLAKSNAKLGRASYEKSPNFLKRIWDRMKTLKLGSANSNEDEYISSVLKANEQDKVEDEQIIEALRSGVGEPEFSVEEFAKAYGISPEEVKTYIENPKIMGMDKSKLFRLRQRNTEVNQEQKFEQEGTESRESTKIHEEENLR